MSDFFTRLVTATYGDAPRLRPRPVAQFEMTTALPIWLQPGETVSRNAPAEMTERTALNIGQSSATGLTPSSSAPADHGSRPAPDTQPLAPGVPLLAPQAGRHSLLTAHTAARQDNPLDDSAVSLRRAHQHATTIPARSAAPWLAAERPASAPVSSAPAGPRQVAAAPSAVITPPLGSPHVAEMDAAGPVVQRAPATSTVAPVSLAAQRATAVVSPTAAGGGNRGSEKARIDVQLPGSTAPGQMQHSPPVLQAEAGTPPAPVVRVTIGRIVIKAEPVAPRAPVRSNQPAAPALSLDQYLKGRDGGGT